MADDNIYRIIARIQARAQAMAPGSQTIHDAMTRIGVVLASQIQINIRRPPAGPSKPLIDTGRLLNSVRFEVFSDAGKDGVRVGSFGVPYAKVHEFGFNGTVTVRDHQRTMNKVFGRQVDPRKIDVRAHSRHMRIPERRFVRAAFEKHTDFIIDVLRGVMLGNK